MRRGEGAMRKLVGGCGGVCGGGREREKEREEQASSVLSKPLDCVPIGLLRTRARARLSSPNCSPLPMKRVSWQGN